MSRLLALVLTTLALAACSPEGGQAETSADTPTPRGATPASVVPSTSASTGTPASGPVPITLTIGGRSYPATLADNPTARDLADRLPLTLTFSDYHGVEKVAPLPERLTTVGVPSGAEPEINDIGYYAPYNNLVLYYDEVGYWEGIVRLGTLIDGMDEIARQADDFSLTIEKA